MKLKDLIAIKCVNDETFITVSCVICGNMCDIRKGKWFEDHVLDMMEFDVNQFDFDFVTNRMTASLSKPEQSDMMRLVKD